MIKEKTIKEFYKKQKLTFTEFKYNCSQWKEYTDIELEKGYEEYNKNYNRGAIK